MITRLSSWICWFTKCFQVVTRLIFTHTFLTSANSFDLVSMHCQTNVKRLLLTSQALTHTHTHLHTPPSAPWGRLMQWLIVWEVPLSSLAELEALVRGHIRSFRWTHQEIYTSMKGQRILPLQVISKDILDVIFYTSSALIHLFSCIQPVLIYCIGWAKWDVPLCIKQPFLFLKLRSSESLELK